MRRQTFHPAVVLRCATVALVGCILSPTIASAIIIDDYTVGPTTVAGPSVQTQSNLDPAHVLGGSRAMNVGFFGNGSVLTVDPQVGLKFQSSEWGYLELKYMFAPPGEGIDLAQGGRDRFRLTFGDIMTGFTPMALYATLPTTSSSNGISVYAGNWSGMILEFPFSKFPVSLTNTQNLTLSVVRNPPGSSLNIRSITTAAPPLAGDYNRDGIVNLDDYGVWRRYMGVNTRTNSIYPIASADGNGSGIVDAADYLIWRKHMGANLPPANRGGSSVPEPAAPVLMVVAFGMWQAIRRRRYPYP